VDDLSQQLNQILSDPQSMQQIQGIMSSLGLGGNGENPGGQAGSNSVPPAQTSPSPQPQNNGGGLDPSMLAGALSALGMGGNGTGNSSAGAGAGNPLGALSALSGLGSLGGGNGGNPLGGVTPEMLNMVTRIAPLLSKVNQEDDSTRLLQALRPLLSETRRKKVDEAMKILQMMRLLPLLKESGIFSGLLSGLI